MTNEEIVQVLYENRPYKPHKTEKRRLQKAIDEASEIIEGIDRNKRYIEGSAAVGTQVTDASEVKFGDCILYVISEGKQTRKLILTEYDEPVTLEELRNKYKAKMVIYNEALDGLVYQYGNYGDYWVIIGRTIGFA